MVAVVVVVVVVRCSLVFLKLCSIVSVVVVVAYCNLDVVVSVVVV